MLNTDACLGVKKGCLRTAHAHRPTVRVRRSLLSARMLASDLAPVPVLDCTAVPLLTGDTFIDVSNPDFTI